MQRQEVQLADRHERHECPRRDRGRQRSEHVARDPAQGVAQVARALPVRPAGREIAHPASGLEGCHARQPDDDRLGAIAGDEDGVAALRRGGEVDERTVLRGLAQILVRRGDVDVVEAGEPADLAQQPLVGRQRHVVVGGEREREPLPSDADAVPTDLDAVVVAAPATGGGFADRLQPAVAQIEALRLLEAILEPPLARLVQALAELPRAAVVQHDRRVARTAGLEQPVPGLRRQQLRIGELRFAFGAEPLLARPAEQRPGEAPMRLGGLLGDAAIDSPHRPVRGDVDGVAQRPRSARRERAPIRTSDRRRIGVELLVQGRQPHQRQMRTPALARYALADPHRLGEVCVGLTLIPERALA